MHNEVNRQMLDQRTAAQDRLLLGWGVHPVRDVVSCVRFAAAITRKPSAQSGGLFVEGLP